MNRKYLLLFLLLMTAAWGPSEQLSAQSPIYFDDTDPATLILGSDTYEIGLAKTNGALTYILDKATGEHVSAGSRYGSLWGAVFEPAAQPDDYVGGCLYEYDLPDRDFIWTWRPVDHRLTLQYRADPAHYPEVNVWVDITLSTESWFEIRLFLENKSGHVVERVLFPSDLMFRKAELQELLLPIMPGVVLKPGVFNASDNYSHVVRYPGWPGVFADYQALTSSTGRFAMFTVHTPEEVASTWIGPIEDGEHPGYFYLYHTFYPGILDQHVWTSPNVRLHVGQPYTATLNAYRRDNHFADFPDLHTKAGAQYEQLVRAPLIKADTDRAIETYADLLPQIPTPAILHWVAFWQHGFDENYPDLLPPKADFGTQAEMVELFKKAADAGFLNMPYTNPTWWDDEAPTFATLNPTEVAVLENAGAPRYECYTGAESPPPCTPENAARDSDFNAGRPAYQWLHGGYVVSPHVDAVRQRLTQLMQQMAGDLPSDLVFEDQVGARAMDFDYNPAAPHLAAYHQGWLQHTRTYSNHVLMTETGYDRLAETETGFHGSYRLGHVADQATADWWGDGNWHVYPLTAFLTRDKTLFYQHNLAPETFTFDLPTLRWNLATGYMLSYDLNPSEYGGGLESPWLDLVAIVQSQVLAQYADELATDFRFVAPEVSLTTFETFSVTADWDRETPYAIDSHVISPGGVYVSDHDTTVAGMFDVYNGDTLTESGHFIVEHRGTTAITIWQPLGARTALNTSPLSGWSEGDTVILLACDQNDDCISRGTVPVSNHTVRFDYVPTIAGMEVRYYRLVKSAVQLYLPVVLMDYRSNH